jgi:hypothetical protein
MAYRAASIAAAIMPESRQLLALPPAHIAGGKLIDHGDDCRQYGAPHPQATAFDLFPVERPCDGLALRMDLHAGAIRKIARAAMIYRSEQPAQRQPALNFMADFPEPGIESFSQWVCLHGSLAGSRQNDAAIAPAGAASPSLAAVIGSTRLLNA